MLLNLQFSYTKLLSCSRLITVFNQFLITKILYNYTSFDDINNNKKLHIVPVCITYTLVPSLVSSTSMSENITTAHW